MIKSTTTLLLTLLLSNQTGIVAFSSSPSFVAATTSSSSSLQAAAATLAVPSSKKTQAVFLRHPQIQKETATRKKQPSSLNQLYSEQIRRELLAAERLQAAADFAATKLGTEFAQVALHCRLEAEQGRMRALQLLEFANRHESLSIQKDTRGLLQSHNNNNNNNNNKKISCSNKWTNGLDFCQDLLESQANDAHALQRIMRLAASTGDSKTATVLMRLELELQEGDAELRSLLHQAVRQQQWAP